ncbi:MAG: hypothetical protein H7A25_01155 [Leptospiraceae bacterium]|nr:hypothetical protein [Leptospiraceae bacterium]MCP5498483.1 hypothetical protein [Leptospiraceae bacterium]
MRVFYRKILAIFLLVGLSISVDCQKLMLFGKSCPMQQIHTKAKTSPCHNAAQQDNCPCPEKQEQDNTVSFLDIEYFVYNAFVSILKDSFLSFIPDVLLAFSFSNQNTDNSYFELYPLKTTHLII